VSYQAAIYTGEHQPILEETIWKLANEKLMQERTRESTAATPKARGTLRRPLSPEPPRRELIPRLTRLLALALKFEELIRSGVVNNYADVAEVARVSRSRVTQMTSLLNLAPDIQEEILFLPMAEARKLRISEPSLRKLTSTLLWNQQRDQWSALRSPRQLLRSFGPKRMSQ
jgi:hypothetical protein